MRTSFKSILFFCAFSLTPILFSCHKEKSQQKVSKSQDTITIALLPTTDCLPFSSAVQAGYMDSIHAYLNIVYVNSQMDIEQMLVEGSADIGASDMFRTIILQSQKKNVHFLKTSSRQWELFTNKRLRINRIPLLGDRMIGMTRHSVCDYYCDEIEKVVTKKKSQLLLKPQINDIQLRLNMLQENQLDAAILPHPVSLLAQSKGHKSLGLVSDSCAELSGFSVNGNFAKKHAKELALIIQSYNKAVQSDLDTTCIVVPKNLRQTFLLDTISNKKSNQPLFSPLQTPKKRKIQVCLQWLKRRNAIPSSFNADTLVLH